MATRRVLRLFLDAITSPELGYDSNYLRDIKPFSDCYHCTKGVSFSCFDRIFFRFYVINCIKRYKTYHGDILNFMKINNTFSVRFLFSKYFREHTDKTSVFR